MIKCSHRQRDEKKKVFCRWIVKDKNARLAVITSLYEIKVESVVKCVFCKKKLSTRAVDAKCWAGMFSSEVNLSLSQDFKTFNIMQAATFCRPQGSHTTADAAQT